MEVIKELQAAMATAYEVSFENAYKHMKLHIDALVKEAEIKESLSLQKDIKIQQLQHDIAVLQSELQQYEVNPRDLELPRRYANLETDFDPKSLWANILEDDHPQIQNYQKRVEAKYTALYTNLQTFIQTWAGLKSRVLQHKKKLRRWDQQLEREEFSLVLNGQPVKFRRVLSSTSEHVDKQHSQATHSSSRKRPREECPDFPVMNVRPSPKRTSADEVNAAVKAEDDKRRTAHILTPEPALIQSTSPLSGSEPSDSSGINVILPDVHPQPTSQRLSPKVSGRNTVASQQADMGSKCFAVVKNEMLSSSPIQHLVGHSERPFESTQDLDEIGDTIRTPMKPKPRRDVYFANTWDSEKTTNDVHHSKGVPPGQQISQQSTILQPANDNTRLAKFSTPVSCSKSLGDLERRGIPALAEDGDDATYSQLSERISSNINSRPPNANFKCEIAQKRLENLLERSAPSKSPLPSSTKLSISNSTSTNRTPQCDQTTMETSSQMAPNIDPNDEPFRARPLRCLGLEHFKINPVRNEGLDYAYDTVVRRKDDRKCISGCTRPGCCGDRFRGMARLGGLPSKLGTEQEEDGEILREFMGDNLQLLQNLSETERDHLLVEAKARVLANKYGRHRHTHQRAQSPPGFWRTDMPDTQEVEDDREAAQRLEREKVEERYREAMRPGGIWTWADE
ncbi:DNA repair protein Sae2/CtIP [Penicillium paradoxum]|uniref:DNA repair protein Sae2/CtIP n=1 Tax=Penicillium paradoxum TaxID=176176 RepID=UPI002546E86C|nr:DNA repair protein Sae2/CtIP [Penicillium paradoxum]KAJ5794459.1 DNA repair protein Sae2/CtIP [Penicillium paradoxum]